ncbi:hypothetical protein [Meiothermus ruber]|uniref:Uncharacterized protein n=1 Tax=Meiothermus ruber (strain ATCC 35948 / DSM 1279 / VKM B-1258 / 21) TaxID=504728 RepID=D3PRF9_MEIRD|nr:hypothetical protein [Meiothermus ruber]ADD28042.1 hypothetical protein Mrub_1280 [Meiothermus ruber DSM 1279]AGK04512.1 hypothetical protein K649_06060 [Meiothermus ruber DSM 1279]MCL6528754.1 hypothetical protein [Meiothermus ruber]MCX7801682.1 hypothetical protein [Meiothermus ruber]
MLISPPRWENGYPPKTQLQLEVVVMLESVLGALLNQLGEEAFVGIYAKGSALKPWDSPLDYVPELSDIDVQLVLRDPALLNDIELALAVQAEMERRFFQRVPQPLHLPRPQIMVINPYLSDPNFSPSPAAIVQTLFGMPYTEVHPLTDREAVREADRWGLLERAKPEDLKAFPLNFIDMPGKYLFHCLRQLTWRVGPTASRVLSLLGSSFEEAWGHNRTHLVGRLEAAGQEQLAADYAGFYLCAWEFFRSGYTDSNTARRAIVHGVRALEAGRQVAQRS